MTPLEDLRKRLEELRSGCIPSDGKYGFSFELIQETYEPLCEDLLKLAEAYRKMALERFRDLPQTAPFYELFVDDEAQALCDQSKKGE